MVPFNYQYTPVELPAEPIEFKERLVRFYETAFKEIASFIYETPVKIVAMTVGGIASLIFFPALAIPFFGIVGGTVLSRLVVKVIDKYNRANLLNAKCEAAKLNKQFPNAELVAFIVSTFVGTIFPFLGITIALSFGIFKGIIIEIDIYEYKRKLIAEHNRRYET